MTAPHSVATPIGDTIASSSLVAEVYDCLLEASRKELELLLAVFVKASSKQALEAVRGEAVKRGVMVLHKPSAISSARTRS